MHSLLRLRYGASVDLPSIWSRGYARVARVKRPFKGPAGHGEKIWVFLHRRSHQIIYSLQYKLDGFHDLKQLPFNGKKTKPAKLRKDMWSPMAIIHFPEGQGAVGRSAFQKLRELKHLHETSWGGEIFYKSLDQYTPKEMEAAQRAKKEERPIPKFPRTKYQRGLALNNQKTNSIADMAAVLGGEGPGNLVRVDQNEMPDNSLLVDAKVEWSNDQDKEYARFWSDNVRHELFEKPEWTSYTRDVTDLESADRSINPEALKGKAMTSVPGSVTVGPENRTGVRDIVMNANPTGIDGHNKMMEEMAQKEKEKQAAVRRRREELRVQQKTKKQGSAEAQLLETAKKMGSMEDNEFSANYRRRDTP